MSFSKKNSMHEGSRGARVAPPCFRKAKSIFYFLRAERNTHVATRTPVTAFAISSNFIEFARSVVNKRSTSTVLVVTMIRWRRTKRASTHSVLKNAMTATMLVSSETGSSLKMRNVNSLSRQVNLSRSLPRSGIFRQESSLITGTISPWFISESQQPRQSNSRASSIEGRPAIAPVAFFILRICRRKRHLDLSTGGGFFVFEKVV